VDRRDFVDRRGFARRAGSSRAAGTVRDPDGARGRLGLVRGAGLLRPCRRSASARAFDIAQLQIGTQGVPVLRKTKLDEHQQKLVDEKRAEFEARSKQSDAFAKSHFPEGAQLCGRCSTAAVVMMDGCMTCLNCGDSKCG
jgi:hypothetical protein